jgi:hypothetical protein
MMPVLIGVFYHSQPLRKASKSEADASYEHKHISIPHSLEKLQVSSVGIGDKKKRKEIILLQREWAFRLVMAPTA